ncbi:MAG: hypothetical protein U9O82_02145 [Thermodesulfobacteriota bacterium]|nr:hypothetical protein [Thermodesulfobacteriota bacterium]
MGEITSILWTGLGWPLTRLVILISIGLLVANFIESLNWTHGMARLSRPLIRIGHLSDTCGASFSMAFFSGVAANTMLSEAYDKERINKQELILANLFNSLPIYFLHLPTMFFITVPLIKSAAFTYIGLTLVATLLRTILVLLVGRSMLPVRLETGAEYVHENGRVKSWQEAFLKAWKNYRKRIRRVILFTVPIYIFFFLSNQAGLFQWLEQQMASHLFILSWLHPQSIGIVIFHIASEFTAGLAAAGALLDSGTLGHREIILALLAGNVLSSPIRAVRHQFPFYAGIFSTRLASELIIWNQFLRLASVVVVGVAYYRLSIP